MDENNYIYPNEVEIMKDEEMHEDLKNQRTRRLFERKPRI